MKKVLSIVLLVLISGCTLEHVTFTDRKNAIHRARVWHKVDISKMDLLAGPQHGQAFRPEQEVRCTYQEPKEKGTGFSPKFKCKLENGEVLRVKFSSRETLAEIAGTRLLWALGFYTDEVFPVKIRCFKCPAKNLAKPSKEEPRMERIVEGAIVERNFSGKEISVYHDQGWDWDELEEVDPKAGGSSKAEIEALKLLAVFIQHTDSKPSQQRVGCYEEGIQKKEWREVCKMPVMMIQDLGATFGQSNKKVEASSAMYLRGWKNQPVWNTVKEEAYYKEHGKRICIGNVVAALGGHLTDPEIKEEGRIFLGGLLNQLSDKQLEDLFRVARAEMTDEKILENGKERPVTIRDWVDVFKLKRQEINDHNCT